MDDLKALRIGSEILAEFPDFNWPAIDVQEDSVLQMILAQWELSDEKYKSIAAFFRKPVLLPFAVSGPALAINDLTGRDTNDKPIDALTPLTPARKSPAKRSRRPSSVVSLGSPAKRKRPAPKDESLSIDEEDSDVVSISEASHKKKSKKPYTLSSRTASLGARAPLDQEGIVVLQGDSLMQVLNHLRRAADVLKVPIFRLDNLEGDSQAHESDFDYV